jgi:signal transduction histidine kinase
MQAAVLRRGVGRSDRPVQEALQGIERGATRMSRLIEDLLDLTRMEAGQLSIEQTRVPVAQLVFDCIEAQRPLASAASLELRLEVEEDVADVWADRDRLLQVLENLIGNAIKFTGSGGHISVGAAEGAEEVRFWVANSGAAIPAEHLPHLFDRFWQARKTGRRGAGLGLSIVKGIVEAHGGRVLAESTPGSGSRFIFTIPRPPEVNTVPPEPARTVADRSVSTRPS